MDCRPHIAKRPRRAVAKTPATLRAVCFRLPLVVSLLLLAMHSSAADRLVFDFTGASPAKAWQVVNDDVMGGVSTSKFQVGGDIAVFSGVVSLANNGGFASVRSLPVGHNLTGCEALVIRARGDGRTYKLTVRASANSDSPLYQAAFTTTAGEWQEHRLPLKAFVPSFRGRVLPGEPPLDPARIASVGLLISDQQAGPFRLEVAWIKATSAAAN
jgi:monofunctional biosynthetic peptidoglycan transglycosylase